MRELRDREARVAKGVEKKTKGPRNSTVNFEGRAIHFPINPRPWKAKGEWGGGARGGQVAASETRRLSMSSPSASGSSGRVERAASEDGAEAAARGEGGEAARAGKGGDEAARAPGEGESEAGRAKGGGKRRRRSASPVAGDVAPAS